MITPSIRNILVPVDFSRMSNQAIGRATRLSERFGATVHLAHIRDFDYPAGFLVGPVPLPDWQITIPKNAGRTLMGRLRALATRSGLLPANCHVQTGAPVFDELCRLALEIRADLIIMPTHGHTGLKHMLLGSTAERVVQHSPVPVFVTRGRGLKMTKVLVPVDFSGCSLEALRYAIQFAEAFGTKMIVLHVVDFGYAQSSNGYAISDLSKLTEAARQSATAQMSEFVRAANFGQTRFETVIRMGPPVEEICGFAQEEEVDLIITATHSRTGFRHALIGSVAERIVRHTDRSVLVVPSRPKVRLAQLTHATRPARIPRGLPRGKRLNGNRTAHAKKKDRKTDMHASPERRRTNKFRESHSR